MLLLKQIPDHLRLLLAPMQVAAHGIQEFGLVGWPALAETVGLDVLAEKLIGVEFRAIARHPNEPQPLRVPGHKALGGSGSVYRMPIDNQIDPAVELFEQPRQELHEDRRLELAREHHEGERPLVGDGRDHVAAEALTGGPDHRGLSYRGIARTAHVVAAQSHLVTPVNHGLFAFRGPGDRRIFQRKPLRDSGIVALVGALGRFLRAQAPAPEVASHGDVRHP